eukprot:TRINITY_DN4714_c0_g1_i1.p1 TRINITY_DN4714_c0_g1~~TRINITY_DN4714_c0_g1_i1.p1  ORF type:complete len:446 (+),score=102.29 TRINITY_DN4714_c0_g1_i1:119-1339(+)
MEPNFKGMVSTKAASTVVTDSAAGATAYSCGLKTKNGQIATDPDGRPCPTILEMAIKKGMKTGLVATNAIVDATPACFNSHSLSRDYKDFIAEQQVYSNVDVLLGGGRKYFNSSVRADGRDLIAEAIQKGYAHVESAQGLQDWSLQEKSSEKILGLFAEKDMAYEIDRGMDQPALEEMAIIALEHLDAISGDTGFIAMIEGSRIDHGGHNNDPVAHYHDIIAYNRALEAVENFVGDRSDILILSVSDHETGGLGLGTKGQYFWHPEIVLQSRASGEGILAAAKKSKKPIPQVYVELTGYPNLTAQEEQEIYGFWDDWDRAGAIGRAFSKQAGVSWTTPGHTGTDVFYFMFGYWRDHMDELHIENNELGLWLREMLELDPYFDAVMAEIENLPVAPEKRIRQVDHIH